MKYFSAAFSAVCSMMFLGITPVWTPMAHAQGSVSFGGLDSFLEENQLEEAISLQGIMALALGTDDESIQAEMKAYRDILNGVFLKL